MLKVISQCPVCSGRLKVVKLECENCQTVIENQFALTKFDYLSAEELNFVEVFVKCRGNIKEVEKELKISYPTVRARLDEVIRSLGYATPKKSDTEKSEILQALERGEITVEEAMNRLNS